MNVSIKNLRLASVLLISLMIPLLFAACDAANSSNPNVLLKTPETPEAQVFTVIFLYNHEDGYEGASSVYSSQKVKGGQLVLCPLMEPLRMGFSFEGWFRDPEGQIEWVFESDTVSADLTLYAKWAVWYCSVIFDLNYPDASGGPAEQKVRHGDKAMEPENSPERDGFVFNGWARNGVKYNFNSKVSGDFVLTAIWIDILPLSKLPTPLAEHFIVTIGRDVWVDRVDESKRMFASNDYAIYGLAQVKVYVYDSAESAYAATFAAPGGISAFSVFNNIFSSLDNKIVSRTDWAGGAWQIDGNWSFPHFVIIEFLEELLGEQYSFKISDAYWFRIQFIAVGSNRDLDSDLGPVTGPIYGNKMF